MRILVINIGGSTIKALAMGHKAAVKIDSGPEMTPGRMVEALKKSTARWNSCLFV
jgi:hypothetical protein